MKTVDFSQTGGFRFKQYTLNKMQLSYFELFHSMLNFMGVNETVGNYIISGCVALDGTISSGWMYIDGELLKFNATEGDETTKFIKAITAESVSFKSGENKPVYYTSAVQIDASGVALGEFIRISPVFDLEYVHTDNNFTGELLEKLNEIEAQAQKNVIPDFTENDPASPKYIENKPEGNLLTYLAKGKYDIGDPAGSEDIKTVTFSNVGTSNYIVIGSLVSKSNASIDNDVTFTIREKTPTSFKISLNDTGSPSGVQDLDFDYVLIPL